MRDRPPPAPPTVEPARATRRDEDLSLALRAANMGWWEWDLPDGEIRWSQGHEDAHGGTAAPLTYEDYLRSVHPDDRERMDALIRDAVGTRGSYETEFRTVWPDGSVHWMYGVGRVFCDDEGTPVRLAGVARLIDEERSARDALAEAQRRFERLANVAPVLLWVAAPDGRCTFVNESLCAFTGRSFDEHVAGVWHEIVHPDDLDGVVRRHREAFASHVELEMEYRMRRHDGTHRWVLDRCRPLVDGDGTFRGYVGGCVDIHERREADMERERLLAAEQRARVQLEEAHARSSFLARLGGVLERSLHLDDTLAEVVVLLRDQLADSVAVDVVERQGRRTRRRGQVSVPGGPARPEDCPTTRSVPLVARGRHVGAVVLGWRAERHQPSAADARHVGDIAQRLALWIDNALLYGEREQVADALQASLLPPDLPAIDGMQTAARYVSADAATDVGGDFYDLFPAADGGWVLAVGDVCGKGADAAAVTAMARYTLRATAAMGEACPDRGLAILNQALLREETPERFLTAVLAHVSPVDAGGHAHVQLACAGHPSPLVLRADGTIEAVSSHGALIGVLAGAHWPVSAVDLGPGDALLVATDGVTEADRDAPLDAPALAALLGRELGGAPADAQQVATAVEAIARRRAVGVLRDDVAILVVRVRD
ncbi:SpoIIE family protein phosphatase [Conexibacter sp. W3-3-2]|uniref:SpoIIE family protein phosphatase n=1 Tax=Conexibacter sp. W3-3-2 TaxID=2675227 RepID=UPI0012B803FE|nr:SpoIIE family protein phosphatase [Conexibacter sp. W3-3-2]MTD44579.1 SpoIIE family protein phosphatase [Conexibacter sp. W3-3-2]